MLRMFAILFAFIAVHAQALEVKLLTWNVYMLPSPIKKSEQKARINHLTERLSQETAYDIMVFQEAFMGSFRKKLDRAMSATHPHSYHMGRGPKFLHLFAPGLSMVSKHPFEVKDRLYYSRCSGPDCFAAKGAFIAEVSLPQDKKMQVIVTHMQAGQKEKKRKIRALQIEELRAFMKKHARVGVPQVLAGDLNINALSSDEFPTALTKLEAKAPTDSGLQREEEESLREVSTQERVSFVDSWREFFASTRATETECFGMPRREEPKRLDHVWVSEHDDSLKVQELEVKPLRSELNGQDCDLSDHLPLSVSFVLE